MVSTLTGPSLAVPGFSTVNPSPIKKLMQITLETLSPEQSLEESLQGKGTMFDFPDAYDFKWVDKRQISDVFAITNFNGRYFKFPKHFTKLVKS